MHMLACAHTRTVSHACTARGGFSAFLACMHTQHTHTHTGAQCGLWHAAAEDLPRNGHRSLFLIVLPRVEREENVSGGRKTSKNTVRVGATAEVKQSESCRQSFNLKRTRSPWGARGAGRIKKFNNSMFYGPRK